MKTLGYLFAILGAFAFVSLFFGYSHQILSVVVCGLMAYAILSDSKGDEGCDGMS